jgi:hypothetical protein
MTALALTLSLVLSLMQLSGRQIPKAHFQTNTKS